MSPLSNQLEGAQLAPKLLSHKRVIVDAFNADIAQGSGITTYTRTLCQALEALDADVALLHGRQSYPYRDPLAREASFHDAIGADRADGRLAQLALSARKAMRAQFRGALKAYAVGLTDSVIRPDALPRRYAAYNVTGLTEHSARRHSGTGKFTSVRVPGPEIDIAHLTFPWPVNIRARKRVVTIHDLIPLRLPYTTLDNKREFAARVRKAVALADLVVTVSEASKRDIASLLEIRPDKIAVTYQSADITPLSESERKGLPTALARKNLSESGYALFVSSIEPKKNLRRLVQAYLEGDFTEPLVVVGRKAWMWEEEVAEAVAANLGSSSPRVIFLDYVTQKTLRHLYAGARCVLFPSLYEGFGLPCLEAMKMGTPVLTSKVASLPEVCGDAAVYVDPFDVGSIHAGIVRIMTDAALRGDLVEKGRLQAERFTAARYAEALTSAYQTLL